MNQSAQTERATGAGREPAAPSLPAMPAIDPACVTMPRFAWMDVPHFFRDPLSYLLRVRRERGPCVRLPLGPVMPILVSDPAHIEHVLVTDNKSYKKDWFMQLLSKEALGQGLLTSHGELWLRQRRLAQPAFHRDRIAGYAETMVRCAEHYVDRLQVGQQRAVRSDMMELTLHIVSQALFSDDAAVPTQDVSRALDLLMQRYADNLLMAFPVLRRLPLPTNRRFHHAMQQFDDTMIALIARRRASLGTAGDPEGTACGQKAGPHAGGSGKGSGDLWSMLLAAQDEDGQRMSDRQLRDEVITLFSAGHETTALALTYIFCLLSQHPRVLAAVSSELHAVLGAGPSPRLPTLDDLPALRMCEAVVLETLRLYPPAWTLGREAVTDTSLAGLAIPRGTQVWMSQWVVHHDESLFPQATAFRPERWLDGLQKRLPRFAYFPFGGGPRLCIGTSFAMVEATLVLATVARRVHLQVLDPSPRLLPSITLRPRDGVAARVIAAPSGVTHAT